MTLSDMVEKLGLELTIEIVTKTNLAAGYEEWIAAANFELVNKTAKIWDKHQFACLFAKAMLTTAKTVPDLVQALRTFDRLVSPQRHWAAQVDPLYKALDQPMSEWAQCKEVLVLLTDERLVIDPSCPMKVYLMRRVGVWALELATSFEDYAYLAALEHDRAELSHVSSAAFEKMRSMASTIEHRVRLLEEARKRRSRFADQIYQEIADAVLASRS